MLFELFSVAEYAHYIHESRALRLAARVSLCLYSCDMVWDRRVAGVDTLHMALDTMVGQPVLAGGSIAVEYCGSIGTMYRLNSCYCLRCQRCEEFGVTCEDVHLT